MSPRAKAQFIFLLTGLALGALSACTASYPAFGKFEGSDELLMGRLQARTIGGLGSLELEGPGGKTRCRGVTHVPYAPPGKTGRVVLECQDGRTIEARYTVTGWGQGFGSGKDESGEGFGFLFGTTEEEARRQLGNSP